MMAAVILVCSLVLLLQFFVSYCRSLVAACAKEPLPIEVQEVTGISRTASPDDFSRVNAAFFTMNGYVSVLFFVFWAADIFLHGTRIR